MSDGTKIQWTNATWNPIRARDSAGTTGWHCERVSPGCQNCYAERRNEKRFGTGLPYNRKSRDLVEVFLDQSALTQPLHWRRPRRIFVCSMTDLFGEWVPDEVIDRVFAVMALSPQHTFQLLTKRPERMREYLSDPVMRPVKVSRAVMVLPFTAAQDSVVADTVLWGKRAPDGGFVPAGFAQWPLPNVWLGVSVEDQDAADRRIPELLATPAAVRFVSAEPLLGALDLARIDLSTLPPHPHNPIVELNAFTGLVSGMDEYTFGRHGVDWVIVGGESGPGARPCDVEWIRSVVRQCQAAGVAVFYKQGGHHNRCPHDRKGGHFECFPDDLKVREFPHAIR